MRQLRAGWSLLCWVALAAPRRCRGLGRVPPPLLCCENMKTRVENRKLKIWFSVLLFQGLGLRGANPRLARSCANFARLRRPSPTQTNHRDRDTLYHNEGTKPTEQKGEPTLPGSKIPILKRSCCLFLSGFVMRIVDVGYSFFEVCVFASIVAGDGLSPRVGPPLFPALSCRRLDMTPTLHTHVCLVYRRYLIRS